MTPVLAAGLLAAACGAGTSGQSQTSASSSGDICASGPLTLTLLRSQGGIPDNFVIQDFKAAHPCVSINVSEVPFPQLDQKISVLAASDSPPDILMYNGSGTASWAAAGVLLPLEKYMPADLKADTLPATLEESTYKGHLYTPGFRQSAIVLYYNKDLTDKAGIQPPKTLATSWTWDQALAAFQKCQEGPQGAPTVWGLGSDVIDSRGPSMYADLLFARSEGNPHAPAGSSSLKTFQALSPNGKTVDGYLNTPEAIKGYQFMQDLTLKYKVTPKAHTPNEFTSGKTCFDIDYPPLVGLLRKSAKFNWGITPLPHFGTPITHTGGLAIGVSAKTKHPGAAAAFVMFAASKHEALKAATADGSLPVLKSLYSQIPGFDTYPMNIFPQELEQWGRPRPVTPHANAYNLIVTKALQDIALGADPKHRIDQAVAQLDSELSRPA